MYRSKLIGIREFAQKRLLFLFAMLAVVTSAANPVWCQTQPGTCLSEGEARLAQLVNDYRQQRGLDPIPVTESLTEVAQWHVWDLDVNHPQGGVCNLHSWSDGGIWTPVCYTDDHENASGMWYKPREITSNAYTGIGFEIIYWTSGTASPEGALNWWKQSGPHNDVILNADVWDNYNPWPAMGVGMRNGYASIWFGSGSDPKGPTTDCSSATATAPIPTTPTTRIEQVHPNPFNPRATIELVVAEPSLLRLTVHDVKGRQVATLLEEWRNQGRLELGWDGRSDDGERLPSGAYFLRLEAECSVSQRKILLLQ